MRKYLILLPIIFAGFIIYFPSLKYGFSQDDFIHLSASQASSIIDFINFFNPFYHYPDIFFYRPITTQLYFFINQTLFGLNPLPYHLEGLTIHLINSVLFFFIIQRILKKVQVSFIAALFYSVSAVHFLSLYYISAFQEIGRTFFIFLAILTFQAFQENKKKIFYILSLIAFIFSLLSKETSIVLPLLLLPLEILRKGDNTKKFIKDTLKLFAPFIVVVFVFAAIRFIGFQSIFSEGSYKITNFSEIFQNLKWYLLWSIGLPEVLSSWPSLKPNALMQFGKDLPFGNLLLTFCLLFAVSIIILFIKMRRIIISKIKYSFKKIFLLVLIFLIPIIPVMILHQHRYPQYLDLAFLGFLPVLAWLFYESLRANKAVGVIGILLFIAIQLISLQLSEQTHWTIHRAKVADYYFQNFRKQYPVIDKETRVVFVGTKQISYELSLALAQEYALSVWYPGKIQNVIYDNYDYEKRHEKEIIYPISLY